MLMFQRGCHSIKKAIRDYQTGGIDGTVNRKMWKKTASAKRHQVLREEEESFLRNFYRTCPYRGCLLTLSHYKKDFLKSLHFQNTLLFSLNFTMGVETATSNSDLSQIADWILLTEICSQTWKSEDVLSKHLLQSFLFEEATSRTCFRQCDKVFQN